MTTAKQKAKELIRKFRIKVHFYKNEDDIDVNQYLVSKSTAKKAAVIHVDIIIPIVKKLEQELLRHNDGVYEEDGVEFWEQVKTEIQNYKM